MICEVKLNIKVKKGCVVAESDEICLLLKVGIVFYNYKFVKMFIDDYNLHGYLLMCMDAYNLRGMRIGNYVGMAPF